MKKLAAILIILGFAVNSFAQDVPAVAPEKNILKVNTLALIIGSGAFFYEREISDLTSAQFGFGYLNYRIGDAKFHGLVLTPEFRFYIRKNAIDGFYIAPYLRYNDLGYEEESTSSEGTMKSFGGGVAFGRQWIFKKGLVIDLFFGGHYTDANVEVISGTDPSEITKIEGFRTRVGFALGFAF